MANKETVSDHSIDRDEEKCITNNTKRVPENASFEVVIRKRRDGTTIICNIDAEHHGEAAKKAAEMLEGGLFQW